MYIIPVKIILLIMFVLDSQLLPLNVITACRTHQQHLSFTPWAWRQRKMAALWIWNSLIFINFGFFVVELLKKQRKMNSEKKQKQKFGWIFGGLDRKLHFFSWMVSSWAAQSLDTFVFAEDTNRSRKRKWEKEGQRQRETTRREQSGKSESAW